MKLKDIKGKRPALKCEECGLEFEDDSGEEFSDWEAIDKNGTCNHCN
jgi:hypothetical protein